MLPANDPSFTLRVAGTPYIGWTSIELNRSIERMSGEFRLELTRKGSPTQISTGIAPGQECEIEIDGQSVLKGFIDGLNPAYDDQGVRISTSGRDVVGDLIDCAAAVDGPFEFNGGKLEQFVSRILAPYKIPLTVLADTGAPLKRIAIQPGETALEVIDRVCRYRAVLPVSDGVGGLMIIKPGTTRSPGTLSFPENILSGENSFDWRDRFSLFVVKGQGEANGDESAKETATGEGRASDPFVTRYRPTVITGENQGFDMTLKERAEWEAQFARARSVRARYSVQGWYADRVSKTLWLPNTIVPVKDEILGLSRDMLITGVGYRRSDNSGTTTDLELSLPEAFNLPAEVQPDADDIAGAA